MELSGKKILVTGGSGLIGNRLVSRLQENGISRSNIYTPTSLECDLRIFEQARIVAEGKDVIIHLAAVTGGIDFHKNNPGLILRDNIAINANVFEAARLAGVKKLLTIGSAALYKGEEVPYKEGLLDTWNYQPDDIHGPYNFSKYFLLLAGRSYRLQYGLNSVHLVFTNVYGPGDRGKSGYVIPSLIKRIEDSKNGGTDLEVWGSGIATRDFLYIDDAVDAIILALQKYDSPDPLNIGSGKETSIKEIAQSLCELLNFKGNLRWLSEKPEGQLRRLLDITKAVETIGFFPKTTIAEGLKRTVEWYLNRP